MARTARNNNISLEEKLKQALVPDVEQPYRIPKNWCWVRLDDLTSITAGGTPARNNKKFWEGGHIPWVKISDLSGKNLETTEEKITQLGLENSSAKIFKKGTILYTIFATIGEVAVLNIDAATNQAIAGITCKETQSIDYMYYVLLVLKDLLVSKSKGVAQVNINQTILKETPIPLAPLAEQQRIVELIEDMFAKLDEAKAKAQAVIDGYEDRKATILHKAFLGELTAEWRNKNQINKKQWMSKQLFAITENFDSKRIPLSKNERENLAKCYDYYGASGVIDQVDRYLFDGKYLLIGEDGANLVSRSTPIAFIAKGKFWVNNHAHVLSVKEEILMEFLCYYINSISLIPYVTGSAQPKMTQAKMNTIPIPVPTIDEQQEIINTLDGLFAEEKIAKEAAEQVRDQIDSMKKSILARAFRGKLGTNDPNDEPAIELLKRIL